VPDLAHRELKDLRPSSPPIRGQSPEACCPGRARNNYGSLHDT
jgi:hypothetical protein